MPDPLDIVTLNEAKSELNIDINDTSVDAVISRYVTAASRRIDKLCGPVVARTVTDTFDGGRLQAIRFVRLSAEPVLAFTSVTEYAGGTPQALTAETLTTNTVTDYQFVPETGMLFRRASGNPSWFPLGEQNIVVVYTAGRAVDTTHADADFKMGALWAVKKMWSGRTMSEDLLSGNAAVSPFGVIPGSVITNGVKDMLAEHLRPPNVA
jgi:hypothetical protein